MKRIGIDARLYFQTGVGVYIRNFLHFLQEQTPSEFEFYIFVLKKDSPQIQFSSKQFIKVEVNSHWHSLSEQFRFYNILKSSNLDLMHFTYFSYPVLYKKKFVATIHDVTPLIHKTGRASTLHPLFYELKYKSLKFVLQQQMKNASVVITPTKTVKTELLKIYGEKYSEKIKPIYEGVNYEIQKASEHKELSSTFNKPFFLYVGNFYPHKNVSTLVEAFKSVPESVELVLVGPDNYFTGKLRNHIEDEKIKNIRFYHTGSNEDLIFFYKNALALVNPSVSEGFGLPLVEAAYFNLPIIASDLPVFHELLGDNFISFNPKSSEELQSTLLQVIEKKPHSIYPDLLAKYSFKKMTEHIVSIYKKELL